MANKRTLLTKEYLQFLGVKDVTEDGIVIGAKGNPIAVRDNGHKYKVMGFNRAELGKPFNLYIHHIVWVWFNGSLKSDWDVHHKDKNPANNALDNLMAMPHAEHLRRHKLEQIKDSTFELKCKLDRPRSYYEELLTKYQDEYLKAPELYGKSTDPRYKRVVANIANTKARLRYYDNHRKEAEILVAKKKEYTEEEAARRAAKKQSVKDRKLLEQYKIMFKEAGNKGMWRQMIKVINAWDTLEQVQKDHVFDTLHRFFSKYGVSF